MQIHPLVTVKKAAAVLGVDKKVIREKLTTGEIKGERRRVGEKDKWFVYHGAVQDLLETERLPELDKSERISTEGLTELFDDGSKGETDADEKEANEGNRVEKVDSQSVESISSPFADLVSYSEPPSSTDAVSADIDVLQIYQGAGAENAFDFSHTNPGRAAIAHMLPALDEFLNQLTIEFAHRLAQERGQILRLQQDVALRDERLERVSVLELKLRTAKESMETRNVEVANLQERIVELETELAAQTEKANLPWWKKLFA